MQDPQLQEALALIRKQDERIEYLEDMVEGLMCTVKVLIELSLGLKLNFRISRIS